MLVLAERPDELRRPLDRGQKKARKVPMDWILTRWWRLLELIGRVERAIGVLLLGLWPAPLLDVMRELAETTFS